MTDTQIRYVELFVTAIKTSTYEDIEPKSVVYIDYLSLDTSPAAYLKQVRTELDGISQEEFRKKISIDDLPQGLERKVKALHKTIEKLEAQRIKTVPHTVVDEEEALNKVYSFYTSKRAHKYESDVILFELSEGKTLEISNMLQVIGKDYLRLQVLEEIERHLEFNEFYSLTEKRVVDNAADACHIIRKNLIKSGQEITKEQLLQKVLNEFYIRHYKDKNTKETEAKVKRTVYQWVRNNRVSCIKA